MTVTVSKGADSVDFTLVNMLQNGDVVITQDYGLAAMCLARNAVPHSQDGLIYNNDNIEALLLQRHTAKKISSAGGRLKGNPKRKPEQDETFEIALENLTTGSIGMKKLSLNKAAEMFEMINAESHVFYNTETGEFDHYNEYFTDDEDSKRFEDSAWISTPSHRDIGEYDMMADFADTVADSRANELLCAALEGKGAFRRFKDTLHRVGLTEDWYSFKRSAYAEIVKEWCEEHGLDYHDDLAETKLAAIRGAKTTVILDTIETIRARYSCRAFSDKMPSDDDLQTIAEAAIQAPSGMNRQLWRVIVVKSKELLDDLEAEGMKNLSTLPDKSMYDRIMSRGGKLYYNAPCMIVVPIAKAKPAGAELFDCGIVAENIALAATSLGIDNLICGLAAFSFTGEKGVEFKRRLDFPDGYEIGIAVLLGYAVNPGGKPHEPDLSKITIIE